MIFGAKTAAGLLALAAPLTTALGTARVTNNCDFNVTLWSVGSSVNGPLTYSTGESYQEEFFRDPITGGMAIKITRDEDGLYNGSPQLIFSYTLDPGQVWYDLSTVFGEAFEGHKLVVASAKEDCPQIVWEDGTLPAGSQVKDCTSDEDVTLTLCAAE